MAAIERIQLSKTAKDQLLNLRRRTGIRNWNVLCRWAFCASLAELGVPPPAKIPADGNVEMTWKVFGGAQSDLYMALLRRRCEKDGFGTADDVLAAQFRLHLHRGIGYLVSDKQMRSIAELIRRGLHTHRPEDRPGQAA
jgi:DNA sulfur modification protein DndE